ATRPHRGSSRNLPLRCAPVPSVPSDARCLCANGPRLLFAASSGGGQRGLPATARLPEKPFADHEVALRTMPFHAHLPVAENLMRGGRISRPTALYQPLPKHSRNMKSTVSANRTGSELSDPISPCRVRRRRLSVRVSMRYRRTWHMLTFCSR